jgi:S1-C subfamily serine protease
MTNSDFQPLATMSTAMAGLVAAAAPQLVSIMGARTRASGFVWRDGVLVTAEDALHGDGPFQIRLANGETREATLRGRDPTTDIAILAIGGETARPVVFGDAPGVGSMALAIGSVDGDTTAAFGIVSRHGSAWRSMRGGEIEARLELDLRLGRSGEGGLAVGVDGQAFGMVVLGPRRRTLVIPAATIERVASKLLEHGRIARGYLGLSLHPVTIDGEKMRGAMVVSVDPDGPGASAGLHQGDVLVSWNGVPGGQGPWLSRALGPASVGTRVDLGIRRAGTNQSVAITVGERPGA